MTDLSKILIGCVALILLLAGSYGKGRSDGAAIERNKFNEVSIAQKVRIEELEKRQARISEEKDNEWSGKVRELNVRIDALSNLDIEPIRLCVPRRSIGPSEVPATARSGDGGGSNEGHGLLAGGDIRQDLLVYAKQCESMRQRLAIAQKWAYEVSREQK